MIRTVHSIEAKSYRILRSKVDTTHLKRHSRNVAERIVHTTADFGWLEDLVLEEEALASASVALTQGARLIVDVTMVAAGVTRYSSLCLVGSAEAERLAANEGLTRSAAGFRLAAAQHPDGAIWVVGNAPTALFELLHLTESGVVRPQLVVGLPVGFVGAAESKEALRRTSLPQLSNVSAKGGSAVAAAAVNALLYGDPLKGES